MTRNRASAKKAGATFERSVADYLAEQIDDRIDRRVKTGAKDRGDIAGLRALDNKRVVVEAKNCARVDLPGWTAEAHLEAGNDDALLGVVVHKRQGVTHPGRQWVSMTVDDFCALVTGRRHGHRCDQLDDR